MDFTSITEDILPFFKVLSKYVPLISGGIGIVIYIFTAITYFHKDNKKSLTQSLKIQLLIWSFMNTISQIFDPKDNPFLCRFQIILYDLSLGTVIAFDACFVLVSYITYLYPEFSTVHRKKFIRIIYSFIYVQLPLVVIFKLGYTIDIPYMKAQGFCLVPIGDYLTFLGTIVVYTLYLVTYVYCLVSLRKHLRNDEERNKHFLSPEQNIELNKKLIRYVIVLCATLPLFFITRICGFIYTKTYADDEEPQNKKWMFNIPFVLWCCAKGIVPVIGVLLFGMVDNYWYKFKEMINCCGCLNLDSETNSLIQLQSKDYSCELESAVDLNL